MKKFHFSAIAAALALMVGGAHAGAAPTAVLRVTGTLDVPPCEVRVEGDGLYMYNDLGPQDIKPGTAENKLQEIVKHWMIECEGDTYLTYKVSDNQPNTESGAASDLKFGLGTVNENGKIGYYNVAMRNHVVDETKVRAWATARGIVGDNATGQNADLAVREGYDIGWLENSANMQQIGRTFEADLAVTATLAGSKDMNGPIKDDVELAGSLTLTFNYGL